jgi:hypothetical protein
VSPTSERPAVECYSGYRGEETPRAVFIAGKRLDVVAILSRERFLNASSGRTREAWRCRLSDGRVATVELLEAGAWRVSF